MTHFQFDFFQALNLTPRSSFFFVLQITAVAKLLPREWEIAEGIHRDMVWLTVKPMTGSSLIWRLWKCLYRGVWYKVSCPWAPACLDLGFLVACLANLPEQDVKWEPAVFGQVCKEHVIFQIVSSTNLRFFLNAECRSCGVRGEREEPVLPTVPSLVFLVLNKNLVWTTEKLWEL